MRILKFIGAFLGTLAVIFILVFGFNLQALFTLFENSEDLQEGQQWVSKTTSLKGLTEYIGQNPQHVSVMSRSVPNPDTTIAYREEVPRTMGTLSNLFVITTYARLVEEGQLDPGERIPLDEIDRHQLPYIDASNHEDAKNSLRKQENGAGGATARLDDLVQAAIIYNDIAISDYLYQRMGTMEIQKTMEALDLRHTDTPLPFAGMYIALHPALGDTTFEAHFEHMRQLPEDEFRDTVVALSQRYLREQDFHQRVNQVFNRNQGLGIGFTERRNTLRLFPKSTARELSGLMVDLERDSLLSPAVSGRVKALMSWPYDEQSLNSDFEYYGAIYDNRLGLLNGIDYGSSVYSSEPFGQAVFFDSLQVAFWFHMSSNLMHQDYQQRLMWDPALRTTTLQEIAK